MNIKEKLLFQANFAKYCLKNKVRKLQIGCGDNLIRGFFNTDIKIKDGVYYLDATKPFPIKDNMLHYIFSEHNFEHLTYHEGKFLLSECYRVLKPKGIIRLSMPSIEFLMDIVNNPNSPENVEYMKWHFENYAKEQFEDFGEEYSSALLLNNFMRLWGHKCLYDKSTIKRLLEISGFKNVTFCSISKSGHEELNQVEHHQHIIPVKFNAMETICLEAEK